MRNYIIILFMIMPLCLLGQSHCYTCINDVLKTEMKGVANRGVGGECSLRYDKEAARYVFMVRGLAFDLDKQISIDRALSRTCGRCLVDTLHLNGYLKFDNYSDSIFLRLDAGEIFVSVEMPLLPRYGMDAFVSRWSNYLDSLAALGEYSYTDIKPDTYVHFTVERDGSLIRTDTSALAKYINGFIRRERKWMAGTLTLPTLPKVYLSLPREKGEELTFSNHTIFWELSRSVKSELYYSYVFPDLPLVRDIISVVAIDGRYSVPVVHKGTDTQRLIDIVTDENRCATRSDGNFSRIYFYTLER